MLINKKEKEEIIYFKACNIYKRLMLMIDKKAGI